MWMFQKTLVNGTVSAALPASTCMFPVTLVKRPQVIKPPQWGPVCCILHTPKIWDDFPRKCKRFNVHKCTEERTRRVENRANVYGWDLNIFHYLGYGLAHAVKISIVRHLIKRLKYRLNAHFNFLALWLGFPKLASKQAGSTIGTSRLRLCPSSYP